MPRDDTPMVRGLTEQLVMPKTGGATEQLRRGNCECRIPQQIVETWSDSPRAQGMEQNVIVGCRLVGVIFIK